MTLWESIKWNWYPAMLAGIIFVSVLLGLLIPDPPPASLPPEHVSPWYDILACARIDGHHVEIVGIINHAYLLVPAKRTWRRDYITVPVDIDVFEERAQPTLCPERSVPAWAKK